MASQKQIQANRQNAQKSTGPKTEEGKAASSQNAVKHGLTARQDVIATESQELYDLHRDQMLDELNPTGPIETMLAERIVSLSWRLDRAITMQTDALNAMMMDQCRYPDSAAEHTTYPSSYPTRTEDFSPNTDLLLGCSARNDFRSSKVLDHLLMYERRIERSLYKTIAELRQIQNSRKRTQTTPLHNQYSVVPSEHSESRDLPFEYSEPCTDETQENLQNEANLQGGLLTPSLRKQEKTTEEVSTLTHLPIYPSTHLPAQSAQNTETSQQSQSKKTTQTNAMTLENNYAHSPTP